MKVRWVVKFLNITDGGLTHKDAAWVHDVNNRGYAGISERPRYAKLYDTPAEAAAMIDHPAQASDRHLFLVVPRRVP